MEFRKRQGTDIAAVHPAQFGDVKNRRGFVQPFGVKYLFQLGERKDFLFGAGVPAQERNIIQNRSGQVAFGDQILERRIAVALGELVLRVFHHLRDVNVNRRRPAERFVNQVIFRGG